MHYPPPTTHHPPPTTHHPAHVPFFHRGRHIDGCCRCAQPWWVRQLYITPPAALNLKLLTSLLANSLTRSLTHSLAHGPSPLQASSSSCLVLSVAAPLPFSSLTRSTSSFFRRCRSTRCVPTLVPGYPYFTQAVKSWCFVPRILYARSSKVGRHLTTQSAL